MQTADCRLFNKIMLSFPSLRAKWSDIWANWSKDFQYDQPEQPFLWLELDIGNNTIFT